MEKLPQKWGLRVTKDTWSILENWRLLQPNADKNLSLLEECILTNSPRVDNSYCFYTTTWPGVEYTEILFEDFERLALNKEDASKESELIPGNWYEYSSTTGSRWIFKFASLSGGSLYTDKSYNITSPYKAPKHGLQTLDFVLSTAKPANLEEVYKYFPEERPKEEPIITEPKFEVGKWYKVFSNCWLVFKVQSITGKTVYFSNRQYYKDKTTHTADYIDFKYLSKIEEVPLSEIQQYLPDNHPDKIVKPMEKELTSLPEKWFVELDESFGKEAFKWARYCFDYNSKSFKFLSSERTHGRRKESFNGFVEISKEQFKKWILKEEKPMNKFKVGDKIKVIGESGGWGYVKKGDEGVIIRTPNLPSGDYTADFANHTGWLGKERCFELISEKPKSLVGRYVKALENNANSASVKGVPVKAGEYYLIGSKDHNGHLLKGGSYCGGLEVSEISNRGFEIMPEGFEPNTTNLESLYSSKLVEEMLDYSKSYTVKEKKVKQKTKKQNGFDESKYHSNPYNQLLTVKTKKLNKTKTKLQLL